MWFATENGIARFDGKTFKTFTRNDGLTDNLVLRLLEDQRGRIWIASFTGKLCYYLNGKIHNPGNDPLLARMPDLNVPPAIPVEDKNGIVYFGREGSFFVVNGNKIYSSTKGKPNMLYDSSLKFPGAPDYYPVRVNANSLRMRKDGYDYYSYIQKGYYRPDAGFGAVLKKASLPFMNIIQYQKKIKDDLWFTSSDNGAFQISSFGHERINVKQYLEGIVVNDIFLDNENNLWFSTTGKGVYLLPGNSKNALNITKSKELPQENISSLYIDKEHIIWIGGLNNYLYRLQNNTIHTYYSTHDKEILNYCYDVVGDSNQDIYFANNENLFLFKKDDPNHIPIILNQRNKNHFPYSDGNYKGLSISEKCDVLATVPFKLLLYEQGTALGKKNIMRTIPAPNTKRILTSFITKSGKIWAANSEGLYKVEGNKWIKYYSEDKILQEPISRIAELNDGNLLITTRSKGVILFDGKTVKQVFSEKEGLASDICRRIFIKDNHVWVSAAKGITELLYQNGYLKFIRNYTTNDGLMSNEINDVLVNNDTLYIATANGLTILQEIKAIKTPPPPVYINAVQYGPFDISGSNDTILKYAHDYVKFSFIGITYQQPQKIVYKYRLLGSSDIWQTTSYGSVDYPSLAPGDYFFEVMAKKTDSDWSLPKKIHLLIKAPFWMETWFYFLIYGILLLGLGFAVYFASRMKRKQNEKKFALQTRMVQLEHQALSALMNPHFIFNALNSIQQFLHQNDALAANRYLSLFARLTRKNMEAIVKNNVSLEEELERLELYLNFEKLRFGDKLTYQININPDLETDEILIPPMVLQPFVENAIWHGIMPLEQGGNVYIDVDKINATQCKIEIKDNGIGIDVSRERKNSQGFLHNSKGMQLTIERLELWARGLNTQFELKVTQNDHEVGTHPGTVVKLILPVQP